MTFAIAFYSSDNDDTDPLTYALTKEPVLYNSFNFANLRESGNFLETI